MAFQAMPYWVRRRIFQRELELADFSGGLNLRDAPSELANNETPDCWNVTLDERGGVTKRLGHTKKNSAAFTTSSPPQNIHHWKTADVVITQCGADLFKDDGTSSVHTFSTAARAAFAEFGGSLYCIHPADGILATTDGSTWSAVSGSPKGTCLAAWQNRLLAAGDPANPPRLYASGIGDSGNWTYTAGNGWFNDIREIDSEPITALAAASGVDIAGKPGIIVFKRRSCYRVNDPDTGSYQTLSPTVGAANAIAAASLLDICFFINETGIYATNGTSAPTLASAKLQPLFQSTQIAFDQTGLYCAGAKGDRVHFSLPRAGSTANDLHLEYHPQQGWIVPHSDAASCYALNTSNGDTLYAGSPTVDGQVYTQQTGGSDDGADITCRYQTKWIPAAGGIESRMRRLRVFGRGVFTLEVRLDFAGAGDPNDVTLSLGGMLWNTDKWNQAFWGPTSYESSQDFWALGQGKYVSFVLTETSSLVAYTWQLLGADPPPQVGSFALYGLVLQSIPISL